MENNELKRFCIKNRMCHYFEDIIKIEDFDFDNILLNEKSYKNILVYDISYKSLIGAKKLRIWFNKVSEFMMEFMFFSYNYAKIKIDSYDSLPLEKTSTLHNVIILIKLVFNKYQTHYYYNIFLEKCSNQLAKTMRTFFLIV